MSLPSRIAVQVGVISPNGQFHRDGKKANSIASRTVIECRSAAKKFLIHALCGSSWWLVAAPQRFRA